MSKHPVDPWQKYRHLRNKVNWAKCDKCDFHWPEMMLYDRGDGRKICPNHTDQRESSAQKTVRIEKAGARLVRSRREPIPKWPHPPEMRDVSGVSGVDPYPLRLTIGGASDTVTLTGRQLSDEDTIAFSDPSVEIVGAPAFSAIDTETRGNEATVTVQAPGGAVPGEYDLLFNGDRFPKVFEVRV